jgi:hypothetical protein
VPPRFPSVSSPPAIAAHNTVVAFCRGGVSAEVSRGLSYVLSARPVYLPLCLPLVYLFVNVEQDAFKINRKVPGL